jgi:hypothetical protein
LYSGEFGVVPFAMAMDEFPPWQSVQPRCTVFVGCIVGSSVEVWQEMQPADLRSASSCDWPRNGADSCTLGAAGPELAQIAKNNDNPAAQATLSFRSEEMSGFFSERMFCLPQKVNFTEPKSENCVRPV